MRKFKIKCTVPSGRTFYIPEIDNSEYYIIHKYILNEDYTGFYDFLNECISETCPEIYDLNLLDKFYIYLTIYAYSIKSNIELQSDGIESFGMPNVYSLFDTLEKLEQIKYSDVNLSLESKIGQTIDVVLTIPSKLETFNDILTFDPVSGIKKIKINSQDYLLEKKDDFAVLDYILTSENYNKIIESILKNFNFIIEIAKGRIELPLLNASTPKYIADSLFYGDLNYQLDVQYLFMRHLNVSPNDYKTMTPADSNILMMKFIAEKKEEEKRREAAEKSHSGRNALEL